MQIESGEVRLEAFSGLWRSGTGCPGVGNLDFFSYTLFPITGNRWPKTVSGSWQWRDDLVLSIVVDPG
jgi:hypothetical protein